MDIETMFDWCEDTNSELKCFARWATVLTGILVAVGVVVGVIVLTIAALVNYPGPTLVALAPLVYLFGKWLVKE